MKKINEIISNNIKRYRKIKRLTQEILAEKLEISTIYMSYLERGTKVPSIELLVKLADILEVDPSILLMKDEEPKNVQIQRLIELLNSLDEPTIHFIDDMAHAILKLRNTLHIQNGNNLNS